jgi:basic membrane protein A and related proteins
VRILIQAATALALCALIGCNGSETTTGTTTGTSTTGGAQEKQLRVGLVFDSGGRGDKSFNDSAYRGLERAKNELGIAEKPVDSKSASDYEGNLEALAEQNMDLILAIGINMKNAVEKIAPRYPNIKFAIVDASVNAPNVRSLLFREEEGSFLAGYVAGLMSKSNKVGFVGGQEIPLIKKFEAGYIAGVKHANPNVQVLPAKYTGSWEDLGAGKQAAKVLYGQGADVVYHAAGKSGLGVFTAAKEERKFAIGVDSDQDDVEPGTVLTSMIKRVDEAVFQTIKDVKEGNFAAGEKVHALADGGVGLSEMKFTRDKIGEENLKKIEDIRQQIQSGAIKVPTNAEELQQFLAQQKQPA